LPCELSFEEGKFAALGNRAGRGTDQFASVGGRVAQEFDAHGHPSMYQPTHFARASPAAKTAQAKNMQADFCGSGRIYYLP